jgi:hypothetical protein
VFCDRLCSVLFRGQQEPLEILRVGSKDTAKEDKGQLNVALSCKVSFSVAEGTGILRAENFQQESAQEKAQVRSQITRVVLSLLLLLALVAALYGYTEYQKYATHQQNVQWLTEFYAENAPQVSPFSFPCLSSLTVTHSVLAVLLRD